MRLRLIMRILATSPPTDDGMIKACPGDNFDDIVTDIKDDKVFDRNKLFTGLRKCNWGDDELRDLFDLQYDPYLKVVPQDPREESGISYLYLSNENLFQIYAYLEGENAEDGYDPEIVKRGLMCGSKVCNYGKSYVDIPLNKSIEEYEEELEYIRSTR